MQCGTSEVWWLDGDNEATRKINSFYLSHVSKSYGNFYLVSNGKFTRLEGNSDYVGIFEPMKLKEFSIDIETVLRCVPHIEKLK